MHESATVQTASPLEDGAVALGRSRAEGAEGVVHLRYTCGAVWKTLLTPAGDTHPTEVWVDLSDAIGPIAATYAPLAGCSVWNCGGRLVVEPELTRGDDTQALEEMRRLVENTNTAMLVAAA